MPDDQHPADSLIEDIKDLFNGDTFKQGLRAAFDRATQPTPKPAPVDTSYHDSMVKAANASFQNQNNVTPSAAAKIRAKASKAVGGS